ncbi:MAG: hypothetical protein ACRET0_00575 [Steroidobacteraceae bacterium]
MPVRLAHCARNAYPYPLPIKQLLHTPLAIAREQEIVYRDLRRYTYSTLRARIGAPAAGLAGLGVHLLQIRHHYCPNVAGCS